MNNIDIKHAYFNFTITQNQLIFMKKLFTKLVSLVVILVTIASFISVRTTEPSVVGIENPKVEKLKLTDGFKAEHLYSPSENK